LQVLQDLLPAVREVLALAAVGLEVQHQRIRCVALPAVAMFIVVFLEACTPLE
jgi:hypothetical protein